MIRNIHMIGICGIAMGTLASMFQDRGYAVSGSDHNMYPPMSDVLRKRGILLNEGFSAGNISDPDLVVIGNAISRGNPEVEHVLNARIPYCSMAQALYNFFLHDKEVIAVAGTHGKTTTTALLAHLLKNAGRSPSCFVGGVAVNYDSNYLLGDGRYFVIEGDEYDSAFFEKVPKFIFYRPAHLVLTSLEFDHADIYKGLDEIELWFRRLVNTLPSEGNIVYSADYANLRYIVSKSFSKPSSYGKIGADFRYDFRGYDGEFSRLNFSSGRGTVSLRTRLFGDFNYANIAAAVSMAQLLGLNDAEILTGVESFRGVKRRQELIYDKNRVKIYEDFAHHPTAVRSVLETMKERYPGARIWALYEPRSATSRRNVFQDIMPASFMRADVILIKTPYEGSAIKDDQKLDMNQLCDDIGVFNRDVHVFRDVDSMLSHIKKNITPDTEHVLVIMSNGGFDGIYKKITGMMETITRCRRVRAGA
jgi:UDP-N-acetylmuramate: L-alanyl-gamma-D-glutamyl-meso-diaminopimelate ligase